MANNFPGWTKTDIRDRAEFINENCPECGSRLMRSVKSKNAIWCSKSSCAYGLEASAKILYK
jgi:cbb3-type cytochrome oxidase cytochrome c subunit